MIIAGTRLITDDIENSNKRAKGKSLTRLSCVCFKNPVVFTGLKIIQNIFNSLGFVRKRGRLCHKG